MTGWLPRDPDVDRLLEEAHALKETKHMTDMPDRYYIGEIIYDELAHNEYIDMNDCQEAADLILASNWMAVHEAEVVAAARVLAETVGDLDALPAEAIVRGRTGVAYEKQISNGRDYWLEAGNEMSTFSSLIELPAQILWVPKE